MPSRSYRLKKDEAPADGVRRIALGRAERALMRLEEAGADDLAVAIHDARKDLKKLRGLLRLVHDELGKKVFRAENRRYRDAGRLLSCSRDAEVKLETLLNLSRSFGALPDDAATAWEGVLETERDELAAAMRGENRGEIAEAIEAIEAGRGAIGNWPPLTGSWTLVGPGLARSYRDGRKAMAQVRADRSAESIHEWRKRAKDLWYQLRILRDTWPELLDATVEQAHALTDLLGDHHDLAVLAGDLQSRENLGDRGPFGAAIVKRQEELLEAALRTGRRLYAEKPKAFERRMRRYWLLWREA